MKRILTCILAVALVICAVPLGAFTFTVSAEDTTYIEGYYTYTVSDGEATITGCSTSIIGDAVIPDTLGGYTVTKIGDSAFYNCTRLTSITVSNKVISIGFGAFNSCTSLASVDIPDSIISIGQSAFYRTAYYNDESNWQDDVLYINNYLIKSKNTISNEYVIKENTKIIADYAFSNCSKLTNIIIPDSVIAIGNHAFSTCKNLKKIILPNSITNIGDRAFVNCTNLTSASLGEGVTNIGIYAFASCDNLTNIEIPDSVTSIGDYAFKSCTSLACIAISDSVTSIGFQAFYDTEYYNNSTNWQENVLYIDNCLIDVKSIILGKYTIKENTKVIAGYAFRNGKYLTSITIPSSVNCIGSDAFSSLYSLENIYITDIVAWCNIDFKNNDSNPLNYAENLYLNNQLVTELMIPEGVTNIGNYAFMGYDKLTNLNIPEGVTSIGNNAFTSCVNIANINISDSVMNIGNGAFSNCNNLTNISVSGSNKNYCSDDGVLFKKDKTILIQYPIGKYDSFYAVPNSVTSICGGAFYNCRSLTNITIPDSVTNISNTAFCRSDNLTTVWYKGSESQKAAITIGFENDSLTSATWYYNTCIGTQLHTYDNNCDVCCNVCGDIRVSSDHVYDNACDTSCDECGDIRIISHAYDNACDTNCNECGYTREITHTYNMEYDYTCNICRFSRAPHAPTLNSKYSGTIILNAVEGLEYSVDGINWQDSPVFSGLAENTQHILYQRVKNSATAMQSTPSDTLTVYLKAWQNAPSAPLVLSFTDTMITLLSVSGCEYSLDGINWQGENVFTQLSPATQYVIYQRFSATDTAESSASVVVKATTDKSVQTNIPTAPTMQSHTANSITLIEVEGCEYSIDGKLWQQSVIFTGLSCGTEYTFYQRYKEDADSYAGKSSKGVSFKTDKGTKQPPNAPTLYKKTYNSITLNAVDGYEYSMDSVNWQTSPVFTGLNPSTNYAVFCRYAENDKYYSSAASVPLTVRTNEKPTIVIGDANGDGEINNRDLALLMQYINGWNVNDEIDVSAIDVNADGKINNKDYAILMRYINGWPVELK